MSLAARLALLASLVAAAVSPAQGESAEQWWGGTKITGDLLGARPAAADRGLTGGGSLRGIYFGVLDSEGGPGSFFAWEFVGTARLDFARLSRCDALEGLAAFGEVRYREKGFTSNPNNYVDASPMFNPSRYAGGTGWRLVQFGLEYTVPEMFGREKLLTLHAGWMRPKKEFVNQPLSALFANSAMAVAEGIGGNIPFTASFTTWGGTLEVNPADWHYAKAGLFMAYPEGSDSDNNGLMFQGYAPDLGLNGLWAMGETGFTPKIGTMPGKYAFGGYLYQDKGWQADGDKYGFYLQADQMVYRELSDAKLSQQGLSLFSLFTFAPAYNNRYPLYMQGGGCYEGLIPRRDADKTLLGVAFAPCQQAPDASYTLFAEAGYRLKISGWAWAQPFVQYVVQPNGTQTVGNAAILGIFAGVDF